MVQRWLLNHDTLFSDMPEKGTPVVQTIEAPQQAPLPGFEEPIFDTEFPFRLDTLHPLVMLELGALLKQAADKHGPFNWINVSEREHLNHALVHVLKWMAWDRSEKHLIHAICRLMLAHTKWAMKEDARNGI